MFLLMSSCFFSSAALRALAASAPTEAAVMLVSSSDSRLPVVDSLRPNKNNEEGGRAEGHRWTTASRDQTTMSRSGQAEGRG